MQPLGNADFLKAYGIKGAIYCHANEHYQEHTGVPLDYPIVPVVEKVAAPTLLCQGRKDPWTNLDFIDDVYELEFRVQRQIARQLESYEPREGCTLKTEKRSKLARIRQL